MIGFDNLLIIFGFLFLILGFLTYWVGIKRKINPFLGVRLPQTLKSADIWEKINVRCGILIIIHGLAMISLSFIICEISFWVFLAVALIPLLLNVIFALLMIKRLKN
ncbi:MAG: hypothetical protein AOA66_0313 [Candidatus Bathyarchaeota archaeon BA2]|nr:MAG: hypothetical protein AOA66_0313 [Candidatus Bathyarchaeota archaeon BA2]